MLKKKESEMNEKKITMIWVLLAFILLTAWAMSQPFNAGPDEEMAAAELELFFQQNL